jgi:very-short-patch-repair endonuclease
MSKELHKGAPQKNFYYARKNRKNLTRSELELWKHLRDRRLDGYKFRRQQPISGFIADFYCHECKLIIELDGEYHNDIEQRKYDEGRTYVLSDFRIKVVRFTNLEVLENIEFVLDEIRVHLLEHTMEKDKGICL